MSEKYFDLTLEGLGYLNNIREIPRTNKEPLWGCTIAALRGAVENADYTYFECLAAGIEVKRLIKKIKVNADTKQRILIGFTLGSLRAKPFFFESGQKRGQPGVQLNTNLIHIKWIKIDGVDVYKAKPDNADQAASQPSADPVPEPVDG